MAELQEGEFSLEEEDSLADDPEYDATELEEQAASLGDTVGGILDPTDVDEEEDFEWVKFNERALKSIVTKVYGQGARFMKARGDY